MYAFIKKPRTWDDRRTKGGDLILGLHSWAAEYGMGSTRLVNCLAYLENNQLAHSGWEKGTVIWVAMTDLPLEPPDDVADGHHAKKNRKRSRRKRPNPKLDDQKVDRRRKRRKSE